MVTIETYLALYTWLFAMVCVFIFVCVCVCVCVSQGTTKAMCTIYLWDYHDKVVISDIDGTITRSDVAGQVLPLVGMDWIQNGVVWNLDTINSIIIFDMLFIILCTCRLNYLILLYIMDIKCCICLPELLGRYDIITT